MDLPHPPFSSLHAPLAEGSGHATARRSRISRKAAKEPRPIAHPAAGVAAPIPNGAEMREAVLRSFPPLPVPRRFVRPCSIFTSGDYWIIGFENGVSTRAARGKSASPRRHCACRSARLREQRIRYRADTLNVSGSPAPWEVRYPNPMFRVCKVQGADLSRCGAQNPAPHIYHRPPFR